jgi:hypothetical protein
MLQPGPVQSVYTRYQPNLQNGEVASSINYSADTRIVESAGGIGFGLAVSQGTNDQGCIIGGTAFVGITRSDKTLARADITPPLTIDVYPQYDNAGILITGDIAVIPDNAVTAGEAVYYSTTTGKLGHSGGTVIEDARWQTSGAAGTVQVVRIGNISGNR